MNAVPTVRQATMLSALFDGIVAVDVALDRGVLGLSLDSRSIHEGDLFLALGGRRSHGLDFAQDAVDNGAVAVAYDNACGTGAAQASRVSHVPKSRCLRASHGSVPLIAIPNLSAHLGEVAARFYGHPSRDMFVIGVTGTNGKTSIAQYLAQALSSTGQSGAVTPCGVVGTLGSGVYGDLDPTLHTTPDAVRLQRILSEMRDAGVRNVVMEVSSHGLSQGRVNGIAFDVAVFTNLSRDHLDYHEDMGAYGAAKQRLFRTPGLRYAVVNFDDAFGRELAASLPEPLRLLTFGLNSGWFKDGKGDGGLGSNWVGHVQGHGLRVYRDGFQMQVRTPWGSGSLRSRLLGRFSASNLLAVLSVLLTVGTSLPEALARVAETCSVPGRMERFGGNSGLPLLVVDYAHTPDALEHVLATLQEHCTGRLWCVFGCGGDRDRGKRPIMGSIAEALADAIILTDDNPRHEDGGRIVDDIIAGIGNKGLVHVERDRARAIRYAFTYAREDDVILVAGKGHENSQQVGDEKISFSDREIAAKLVGEMTR